jgi:dienelactone hydrolase
MGEPRRWITPWVIGLFAWLAMGPAARSTDLWYAYALAEDEAELSRTWDYAEIHIPGHLIGVDVPSIYGLMNADYVQDRLSALRDGSIPLVIFLHGCTGIGPLEHKLGGLFGEAGYAMLSINSFARRTRERNCNYQSYASGMFPPAYLYRRAELIHAARKARGLPWVDRDRLVLAGFSEGAVASALWGAEAKVSAYIIAAWTCTAPPEYRWLVGLRTPPSAPVLAIVSERDPWFNWPGWRGDCGSAAAARDNVYSLVIDGSVHNVFAYPDAVNATIEFLRTRLSG